MQRLYVLFDDRCGLCLRARRWLSERPVYLDLRFIPATSEWARQRFPTLCGPGEPEELIVVSDEGGVYRGEGAWIMVLFALCEYREWSLRLAKPGLRPLARQAFALISRNRRSISRWLQSSDEASLVDVFRGVSLPVCQVEPPSRR